MFDKQWFQKNQRPLLAFVNSFLGRWFFELSTVGVPRGMKVMEIGQNFLSGDWRIISTQDGPRLIKTTIVFQSRRLEMRLAYVYACAKRVAGAGLTAKLMQPMGALGFLPLIALTTSTFYPSAGAASPVDGGVYHTTANQAWATKRGAADGTGADVNFDMEIRLNAGTTNTWSSMYRAFILFDTSSIPDTDEISAATFSVKESGGGVADNFNQSACLVGSTPAANDNLTTADYDQVGSTRYASDIDLGSISTGAYADFALNATGLAAITKTGISKFGMRLSGDADNAEPTWAASTNCLFQFAAADTAGTGSDPKLVVVHAAVPVTKTVTDTLTLTSAVKKSLTRIVLDTLTLTTAVSAMRAAVKTVTDTLTLSSTILRSLARTVTDTLTLTTSRIISLARTVRDTLTLTTIASSIRQVFKTVTDTLQLTSIVRKVLNGAFTIWSNIAKNVASWTHGSKNSTTWDNEDKSS